MDVMAREHTTLMTTSEAAKALEVTTQTIQRWCDSGRLEVIIFPSGHRRIPAESVARLLEPVVLAR